MDEKTFSKLIRMRKETPNIMDIKTPGYDDGKTKLIVANNIYRSYAQNLIDCIDEHRHLRGAKILLLVREAESTAKKLQEGGYVVIGKACKANPRDKLLSCIGASGIDRADFIVWLSVDWLDRLEGDDPEIAAKTLALIDHELLHCGAKIAGKFIKADELELFVESLGDHYLETCEDIFRIREGKRETLVRYYHTDAAGIFDYKMRRHDVEEFNGVVARHGPWDRCIERLIDIIETGQSQPTLFETAGNAGKD